MSNVLIGIIGVILFIGLALAGALFLGPRFQEATNSSKASAITATLQQVSAASGMFSATEGRRISLPADSLQTLVDSRNLKVAPVNPMNGSAIILVNESGYAASGQAEFAFTNLGDTDAARLVCIEIERHAGNPDMSSAMNANSFVAKTSTHRRVGCLGNGGYSPVMYQAYVPL